MTSQVLQLPFLTVPDDPSKAAPPAAGTTAPPPPAPTVKSPARPEAAPGRGTKNLETEMQAL